MKLEQLAPGQNLSGVEPPNIVSVVASVRQADGSVQLIYRTSDGTMKERLLGQTDEALIEIAGQERLHPFNVPSHPQPHVRRAVRVLAMVGELHKRGFQRLRVMPYMAPSGMAWRCVIGPADNFYRNHGAMLLKGFSGSTDELQSRAIAAHYSSGQGNQYFGWKDAERDDARGLADKFVSRFSGLVESGAGWDYPYAGWFLRLLRLAETGRIAFAFADYASVNLDFMHLGDERPPDGSFHHGKTTPTLPLPPAGGSHQDYRTS